MEGYGKRVLVVEHDEDERSVMGLMLENEGYNVHMASEEGLALEEMKRRRFDVVVSAHHMPMINGFRLALLGRLLWPHTPMILVLRGTTNEPKGVEPGRVYGSISKPYDIIELLELMGNAIQSTRMHRISNVGLNQVSSEHGI